MSKNRFVYRFILITVLFLGLFFMVMNAQGHCKENKKRSGRGYVILETNHIDIHDLNSSLKNKGYSQFSNDILGIGLGGHEVRENNLIFDGYASWYFPRNKKSTVGNVDYTSSLSGIFGFYNIGYLVYAKGGINVFPLVGFGYGGMRIHIKERGKRAFDEILENPRGSTIETSTLVLFNFALGIDKLYIIKEKESVEKGLGIGIRLGYRYCLQEPDWPNVTGGPDILFTGPYFSLILGGGYNKKK